MVSGDNGFERPKDGAKVAGTVSAWNAKWFVQAYEDQDGDIYLAAPYMLTGGFVKTNFLAWLNYSLDAYNTFSDELYQRRGTADDLSGGSSPPVARAGSLDTLAPMRQVTV